MCGIVVITQVNGEGVEPEWMLSAASAMRHRGPDDEGYLFADTRTGAHWLAGGNDTPRSVFAFNSSYAPRETVMKSGSGKRASLAMGSRRLAILDLSPAGHQPMCNEDGTLWIVHNGEIYNFRELRSELEALGHRFNSSTDTEVILHAYEQWGRNSLNRFNGMWAFAIWDIKRHLLFCSRDRWGVKPLYYSWDGTRLVIASEPKAMLGRGLVEARPNMYALYEFLAYGSFDLSLDRTFFEGIRALPGGHWMELDYSKASLSIQRYYDLQPEALRSARGLRTDEEYAEEFYELFSDAIRLRLTSDVPIGTCLSGGLDSSSIACIIGRMMREQGIDLGGNPVQKTFSARYSDLRHDEGDFINAVVRCTGADAYTVYPTGESLADEVEHVIWYQDEPFGSTSTFAQWSVFKLARQNGVIVTLDGQGGDEILSGYPHHFGPFLASLLCRRRLSSLFSELRSRAQYCGGGWPHVLREVGISLVPGGIRASVASVLRRPEWLSQEFTAEFWSPLNAVPKYSRDCFESVLLYDLWVGLRKILRMADRSSMAHSVECRFPFLDYRVVEFAFSLPVEQRIRNGISKWVLRQAMRGILPEEVRTRQDKIGFSTPEDLWFRSGFLAMVQEIITSERFRQRGFWHHNSILQTFQRHLKGEQNLAPHIWRWVTVELWMRNFIDR